MVWPWGDCVTRLRLARAEKRMFGSDNITHNWWRLHDSMAAGNDYAVVLIWSLRSKAALSQNQAESDWRAFGYRQSFTAIKMEKR